MELDLLQKFVGALAGAIRNVSYYPTGHPAVQRSVQTIMNLLSPLLEEGEVSVGVAEDVLVVNSEPLFKDTPAEQELKIRLLERGMSAVAIRRGVRMAEISGLVQVLSEDPAGLTASGALITRFRQLGIEHIYPIEIEPVEDKAKRVYNSARNLVIEIMQEARMGVIPRAEAVVKTIGEMADVMISDRNAILGLTMLSSYDDYTFYHSVNVGILSLSLAQHLKYPRELQLQVGVAGLLHDIGKTFTPLEVLKKPGPLTDGEWETIRRHPIDGAKLVEKMEGHPPETATIVFEHHVGYDLNGYPSVEPGRSLHEGSLIITISDTYDSMTTLRVYQRRFDPREALRKMNSLSGKRFEPEMLRGFFQMLGMYPVGSLVRLNTGQIALVTGMEASIPDRPRVKIVFNRNGEKLPEIEEVNLAHDSESREIVATVDFMAKDLDLSL